MEAFPRLVSRYLYSIRLNSLAQEMLQELEMIIECFKFCALITLHYYYYFKFFNFVLLWENVSWVTRRVTRQPELPWTSQRFLNFLIKLWKSFTRETKSRLGYRNGSPFFRQLGHPPSQANFCPYTCKRVISPRQVNSIKARQFLFC